jgi:hypothetical protein
MKKIFNRALEKDKGPGEDHGEEDSNGETISGGSNLHFKKISN